MNVQLVNWQFGIIAWLVSFDAKLTFTSASTETAEVFANAFIWHKWTILRMLAQARFWELELSFI